MHFFILILLFPFSLWAKIDLFDSLSPDSGLFKAKFSDDAHKILLYTVSDDVKLIDRKTLQETGSLPNNEYLSDVDLSGNGYVLLACSRSHPSQIKKEAALVDDNISLDNADPELSIVENQIDINMDHTDCQYYQEDSSEPIIEFRLPEHFYLPQVSYDGRYLLGVTSGRVLKILDVARTTEASSIELGSEITSYDFSDDLRWILIGTITGHYHLWDTQTGMVVLEEKFPESIHNVTVGSDFALVTGRFQDDIVINLETLSVDSLPNNYNLQKRLPSQVLCADFHPGKDNILAIARPADIVEIWDYNQAEMIQKIHIPMLKKSRFKRPTPLALKWDSNGILWGVTAQGEVFKIDFEGEL